MKKMLITGVSGLLGNNLAHLFSKEYSVVGVYNSHPVHIRGVHIVSCDLADYATTRKLMMSESPDVVLHCASRTDVDGMEDDPEGAWQANVLTTRNVVDSLRDMSASLVFISTDSVYSGEGAPHSEGDQCKPKNRYGKTKLEAEGVALEHERALVLRTNLYGWNILNKQSIAEWFLSNYESETPCIGFHDALFNGIYSFLLGDVIRKCLDCDLSGVFNCASRDSISKLEFARNLGAALGRDTGLIRPGAVDDAKLGAPRGHDMNMDMSTLEEALGEKLPTMQDSIDAFVSDHKNGVPDKLRQSMAGVSRIKYYPQRDILPYGGQCIGDDDIAAVCQVLRSDYLTTGPTVAKFENAVCEFVGASHGIAVSNGTAALHATMFALGIGFGDEVIVPTMTFAATANCVLYQGGTPVIVDVEADTLLIDLAAVEAAITPRTKAIIGVDYAGQPCNWSALRQLADRHKLALVADGCHALGAGYKEEMVGSLADMTCFSFHPVKHIATGEGGMVTTSNSQLAERLRLFRNHGITTDSRQREKLGSWFYAMEELGYNYRLTDIQSALGLSQMNKLPSFLTRRKEIAAQYDALFADLAICPLQLRGDRSHAYHLYVVRLENRDQVFDVMRKNGIGVNVHYIPVHLHPYYQKHFGAKNGSYPVAEAAFGEILSLPIFVGMSDRDVEHVVATINGVAARL